MQVHVRVRPGALLTDNRTIYGPGDELAMELAEANRRIKQGKVEMLGDAPEQQPVSRISAAEVIAAVQAATTSAAMDELRNGEDRKTVLAAIEAREQELRK